MTNDNSTTPSLIQAPAARKRRKRGDEPSPYRASQNESNQKWRATKAALGVDYVSFLIPVSALEDFKAQAEETLLKYYHRLLSEEPGSHAILADLRKPIVTPVSFDVFVQEHPRFLVGGERHRKAKALYDSFVTALRETTSASADAHMQKMQMAPSWTKSAARAYVMAKYAALYQRKMQSLLDAHPSALPQE